MIRFMKNIKIYRRDNPSYHLQLKYAIAKGESTVNLQQQVKVKMMLNKVTQVELAKEFDVSRSYLDRMLNERTALTTAVKRKLEAYLSN
jgi:hypothetical protein